MKKKIQSLGNLFSPPIIPFLYLFELWSPIFIGLLLVFNSMPSCLDNVPRMILYIINYMPWNTTICSNVKYTYDPFWVHNSNVVFENQFHERTCVVYMKVPYVLFLVLIINGNRIKVILQIRKSWFSMLNTFWFINYMAFNLNVKKAFRVRSSKVSLG